MVKKMTTRCLMLAFLAAVWSSSLAVEICYDNVGCFSNDDPFGVLPLPQDPNKKIPPTFYLHRRGRPGQTIDDSSLLGGEVVFLVHGYTGSYESDINKWYQRVIDELSIVQPNADVVAVDWEKGARIGQGLTIYTQAASNTRTIGAALAAFINANTKADPSNYHCIGYSLGAHVCGFAGKVLRRRWGRISAIDPAAPTFSHNKDKPQARLDREDADFVDVLHASYVGLAFAVGDSDFWVNSAYQQPGCYDDVDGVIDTVGQFFSCSHIRARQVFVETINPASGCRFKFCPCAFSMINELVCKSCLDRVSAELGYRANLTSNRGEFYGTTTGQPPYCHETTRMNRFSGFA